MLPKDNLPCTFIDAIYIHHKRTNLRCVLRNLRDPYCRFECPILTSEIEFDTTDTGFFMANTIAPMVERVNVLLPINLESTVDSNILM